jgi:hypothetical protein
MRLLLSGDSAVSLRMADKGVVLRYTPIVLRKDALTCSSHKAAVLAGGLNCELRDKVRRRCSDFFLY